MRFFYDMQGSRVTSEIDDNGQITTTHNFDDIYFVSDTGKTKVIHDESGQIAYIRENGEGAIFHKDHLGSHEAESDLNTGNYMGQESYYAYGSIAFDTINSVTDFQYNGKKYSNIPKICFFGGRYYLPELGIFMTLDPLFLNQQPDKFFRLPSSLHLNGYVQNNPINIVDPNGLFFGLDDLIVAAVGFVVGVGAYLINAAVSGSSVNFGDLLMAGLMGAATGLLVYNTLGIGAAIIVGAAMLAAPAVTGALDQAAMGDSFGHRLVGLLSFAIKFAASPVTSTIGLLIGGFGTGFGLWGDVEWFKGGVIAFEYDSGSTGFSATTLGATVSIWTGNTNHALFEHELYHSRQYTYFGDAFVPLWLIGGVYGLISSAAAGNPQWACFQDSSNNFNYGNPLETGANQVGEGGGCA
jgi:RHS repeat-associated protein